MTGLEIFLLVIVAVSIFVIACQAHRNQALARRLWNLIATPQRKVPLPPPAETISLSAFNRATDRRDAEIEDLRRQLAEAKIMVREQHAKMIRWANDCIAEADRAEELKTKLAAAERERDRLVREHQKCRQNEGYIAIVH